MPRKITRPTGRARGAKVSTIRTAPPTEREPEEVMGLIQGRTPGSREEWRMAQALNKYRLDYQYQVIVRGGGGVRGTIILDFLVYNPWPTPVPVHGEYWHRGQRRAEDVLQEAFMAQIYNRQPVIAWGSDLHDQDAADQWVRNNLL